MEIKKGEKIKAKNKKKKIIVITSVVFLLVLVGVVSVLFIPKIKLKGNSHVTIQLNQDYKESGAVATVSGIDVSDEIKIKGNVDTNKPGKYKIEYSVKKGLFTEKTTRIIEVVDEEAPTIELKGNKNVTSCPNKEYVEEGYTAVDNYDGDITNKVVVENVSDGINYSVTDSSNNKTIVKRDIKKEDKEKPTITLVGPSTKYVLVNSTYKEQGVNVKDNCDTNITKKVKISGTVDTKKKGTYKINYEITDESGNKASVTRTVIVYEKSNEISGSGTVKTIYLTFDDGPSKSITPGVLKILKEKGVVATFFVINHSDDLNYLIKQEYTSGHTVALHSYTHDYKTIYSSSTAYFNDLKKISDKVKSITGEESKIMRFPGGASNTVSRNYSKGIMTYLTNEVLNRGYHYFDWNVSSGDAGGAKTKNDVYKNVTKGLSTSRANVVLMHDFENNYKTLNALSDIIDYGLAKGYTFKAIDMTTPLVRHKTNN